MHANRTVFQDAFLNISMSELRPDTHPKGPKDCLHYCMPGVPDLWNLLMYNHVFQLAAD